VMTQAEVKLGIINVYRHLMTPDEV